LRRVFKINGKLLQTLWSFWHLINVRTVVVIFSILLAIFFDRNSYAQSNSLPTFFSAGENSIAQHHTQAKLILSADTAKPGDTILAGVDLKMETGWHTYWKNSGDAGSPTEIKWQLPPGISAGEIQWPLPKKLPPIEVTTYGYEDEVVLLVPLKIETNFPAGQIDLKANVSWLECKDVCIPANQNVEAKLNIESETKNTADPEKKRVLEFWHRTIPTRQNNSISNIRVWWEKPLQTDLRPFVIEWVGPERLADFFPDANDHYEIQPATEMFPTKNGNIALRKMVKKFDGDWPKEISGLLVLPPSTNELAQKDYFGFVHAWDVKLPVSESAPTNELGVQKILTPEEIGFSDFFESWKDFLWLTKFLLFAFIGGLILNIMPCVLPVIALKILGFVSEARSEPRRVRNLGLIYALGVLISFLALAGIVIAVKAAGHHAGWGMQFGSPIFIVCLTTLVTLVALNLFGVFEVTLGGRALDTAGNLASRHGAGGAFFNGILATTLATPCTAPFLAPALGFAFAQNASTIILIFLFVGLGLAAPYVLLSFNPALLKFLPKPGAWMEKFKIAMGFPMLATVVWLFNVAASTYGKNVLWLGIFLVIVAFGAWIFGEFFQRGRTHKGIALALVLILFAGGYFFILEKELNWRNAMPETNSGSLQESADGIDWQRWSPEAVAAARATGKIVLVDFTADWCLTCQVNKKIAIEVSSVEKKMKDLNVVALVADDTRTPENIAVELQKYDRAGVPLVLVYPKNSEASAIVLPAILTPGIVLNALDRAAQ
jgi:thiol:disulfide interchange protein/DsbC/DsbD-like thiol-disulfide interchange protein